MCVVASGCGPAQGNLFAEWKECIEPVTMCVLEAWRFELNSSFCFLRVGKNKGVLGWLKLGNLWLDNEEHAST